MSTVRAEYYCSYCAKAGHNRRTCTSLAVAMPFVAEARKQALKELAKLTPTKHPAHWELLQEARDAVREKLELALEALSDRAPAVKHIKAALKLLEDCK